MSGISEMVGRTRSGNRASARISEGGSLAANVGFVPSSYSANKSATTTVSGQSEAVATGATSLRIRNIGPTNHAFVAFGTSASNAESNASTGVLVELDTTEILGIPAEATHYAWLGDTGTVTLNIIQGA